MADYLYALRRLRKTPDFSFVVVLSLTVGIGASAVLFSLVNAAVLRMIPVREPARLVWFDSGAHGRSLSYPFYQHIQNDSRFDGILSAFPTVVNLSADGVAERATAELVSDNYWEVLGIQPAAGRLLMPSDARSPVAVVSHDYWQTRLGGSPSAIGRTIRMNGLAWTVVGVTPPGFGGLDRAYQRSIFLPMGMKPQVTPGWNGLDKPLIAWLYIAGRLKPGTDPATLGAELNSRFHAFQEIYLPVDPTLTASQREIIRGRQLRLEPLSMAVFDKRVASHLSTLGWMVALLLALTCLNVAGLLLSRGIERSREMATRLAIGCSRASLIRQLLVEAMMLAFAGGIGGLIAAAFVAPILTSRFPLTGAASQLDVPVDLTVVGFAFAISIVTCLLFGLMPAWQATRLDLVSALKGSAAAPSANRTRSLLLSGQVALSVGLLGAAGLFTANLRSLSVQDTGFRLLMAEVEPALSGYDEPGRLRFYQDLQTRLNNLAGPATYESAVMANVAPRSPHSWFTGFELVGRSGSSAPPVRAFAVGPGYLETMRVPLRSGRLLNERDDATAPRVAVISESLARREFPNGSPLGKRFVADLRSPAETTFEIVGVVGDVNFSDPRNPSRNGCVFLPYRQWAFPPQSIVLHARLGNTGSVASAAQAIRAAIRDTDATLAPFDIRTLEQATDALLVSERLTTMLTTFFAAAAALICALGIYGVVSRELSTRMRETAIRLALGGKFTEVVVRVSRQPILAVTAGLGGGAALLLAMTPVMRPLVSDLQASPSLIIGSVLLLALVASIAVAIPATRTRKLAPSVLLRQD